MSVSPARPLARLEQVEAKDLTDGWAAAAGRLVRSRERIITSREIQDGLRRVQSERSGYSDQRPDPLIPRLPQRELLVQRSVNRLIGDRPLVHRAAQGGSHAAGKAADEAERWLNSALDLTYDYEATVGMAHEGEWATVVLPTPADYRRVPDLIDLHTKRKRGESGPSEYRKRRAAYLASRPPWTCRLISPTDCAPVLVRGRGKRRWEVSQLYVRTLYDVDDLIEAGYIFDQQKVGTLVPRSWESGSPYGQGGQVYLYELYATVGGDPCVIYSVAGLPTKKWGREGNEQVVRINLADEFGLYDLPCGYFYGLNQAWRDDPDATGRPYLWALCDLILASEGTLGAVNVAGWRNGFTGYVEQVTPGEHVPLEYVMEGGNKTRPFEIPHYDEVTRILGEIRPFQQAQVGRDVWQSLQTMLGLLQSSTPAEELAGGGDLASGHTGTVLDELDKAANRQIPEGARQSLEFAAERIAELACTLARGEWRVLQGGEGVAIPLYVNEETEPEPGRVESFARALEFKERWFGDIYDVRAAFPQRGNLAEVQQELGLWEKGAATLDDVLEKRGKTSTTLEKMKILLDQELRDPQSQARQELLQYALEYSGRHAQAKVLKLQQQGDLSPGGMPTVAMQGGAAPEQGGAPLGTTLPDFGASRLGGIVAGEMGQASEMANAEARMAVQAAGPNGAV